jgi:hypothetical protein
VPAPPVPSVTVTAPIERKEKVPGEREVTGLTPEPYADTPVRRQGPGRNLPGPGAGHLLHGAGGQRVVPLAEDQAAEVPAVMRARRRRARCVPDRPVNAGTCGHSRTARYTGSPANRQANPLRKPTF